MNSGYPFFNISFQKKYTNSLLNSIEFLNKSKHDDIFILFYFVRGLDKDIENSAKRWKKFVEAESPEREKFPQEWKNKIGLQKLCIMRALRPDRMSHAIRYDII